MAPQQETHTEEQRPVTLTPEQLAKRLNLKQVQTLANWRSQGKGPKFIPGRPIRYPIAEVEKWERSLTVGSTAQAKSRK